MQIAYLVNQYPKISHSFIRREIAGLEACGIKVARFSVRSRADELIDAEDKAELAQTRIILEKGLKGLAIGSLKVLATRPAGWFQGLQQAIRMGWNSERGLLIHLIYLAEACLLLEDCRKLGVQHLHAHFGTNPTAVALLCQTMGGPSYSFTVHGPEEFDKPQAIALTAKIEQAAFVVAVSSFGKSQLYRWCHYPHWAKVQVVHCGVDRLFLEEPPTPIPTNPTFVCVARLDEQKGHLLLLQAVANLAVEGLSFKVVLVGDGSLRSPIEAFIADHQLQNHVELLGWASSAVVKQAIVNAQVMVMPSFAEGLPVVIMEALALGRPVLTTCVAGIPELVEPGICGWLVPPGSVEALTDAMRTVLQTPIPQLEQMGKAGRDRVYQHHNALTEAKKLAHLFERQLGKHQTTHSPTPPK